MMLLIALAITVAFAASWGSTIGLLAHRLDHWSELALLIVTMLGHWIDMRLLGQASSALESLAALLPDKAERLGQDGITIIVPGWISNRTGFCTRSRCGLHQPGIPAPMPLM